jgi:hypothetical protein
MAGDGLTTATAYQIAELGHLVWLGERAAANETAGKYYQLMNDIDASDTANWNDAGTTEGLREGFHPIGTYSSPDRTSFRGIFDGNGRKIIGLTINRPKAGYMGLFGCVGGSGRIRDLTLEEGHVTGAACVGGMAGNNTGRLIGCSSNVPVVGTGESVGGLIGNCEGGRVTNGTASGSVTGTGQVGGLVGTNFIGTLENCSASGEVVGSGTFGGGLIGYNSGMITDCFATGAVTADGTVGGLIGKNNAKILNCFATGPVTGNRYTGGLVGGNDGSISNSFATGSVTGSNCSGGLAGLCWQSGLIGSTISNCFATGFVTGNANSTGGLVGDVLAGTVSNSYWDKTSTGQAFSDGSAASFGKTTAEMKQQATFQPEGGTGASDWDFSAAWKIVEGRTYPYFQSARPPFRLNLSVDAFGSLTLNPSGATVYPPGTTVTYAPGTTVTLTALPEPKYRLSRWIGPVADPTATSTTVLMDTHKSVTARFELNEYKLAVEATSGSVTLSPDQTTYTYGTVVALTATPDAGCRFVEWTGPVADRTAASTTLTVTGDTTVTARFLRSYEIRTLAELQAAATGDLTGYYTLMNDIDASATATWNDAGTTTDTLEGFRPIGVYSDSIPDTTSFRGVFDGNGKKITGLTINRSGQNDIGLFGATGIGGEIRNLTVQTGSIVGNQYVGGLIGRSQGRVTDCVVTGQVTGGIATGGLSGIPTGGLIGLHFAGPITRCCFNGEVSSRVGYVGGLIGSNSQQGTVTDCSATGTVTAGEGAYSVGGLIAMNSGSVVNSSASNWVVGTNLSFLAAIGGLVGENFSGATIETCFASGRVDGTGNNTANLPVGGLVGVNNASIRNCFATGAVTGRATTNVRMSLGGLVGSQKSGSLANSFATGSVTSQEGNYLQAWAGLVGNCEGGTVRNCFANGRVTGTGTYVGGCIGRVYNSTVKACYWDVETSGWTTSAGGTGAIGKTTAEMKQKATFQPGGGTGEDDWDFASVWGIVEGQTYPFLRTASEPSLFRLDVSVAGQGAVTLDPPGGLYAPGTVVTLTATANTGNHLLEWIGSVTDPNTPVTSIILDTPKSVTARFLPSHEIRTLEELQALSSAVPGEYYILMNDIDASDTANWNDAGTSETDLLEGFCPIGTYSSPDTTSFRAIFNGNGKKITGLTINRPAKADIGLFGALGKGGEIRNLKIEQGRVVGNTRVGGLVGTNAGGIVSNCSVDVQVKGGLDVGGLVGSNRGKLTLCAAAGSITGNLNVGGLSGEHMTGSISDCFAVASVMAMGDSGGLIGLNGFGGIVINSFATGDVAGTGQYLSSNNSFGGLIGYTQSDGKIEYCYATGNVTGQRQEGQTLYMGGLIGYNGGDTLTNCFATGSITCEEGDSVVVGGLVGYVALTKISKCFASGRITCGTTKWPAVGGLVGNCQGIITACYWDKETTGQTTSSGSAPSSGKTTAEMKQQATFLPGGGTGLDDWDFTSVWGIVEGETYPFLRTVAPLCCLTVAVEGQGTVALSPLGTYFAKGTWVTLTARPNAGVRFARWTGDVPVGAAGQNPLKIQIQKDTSLTVRFEAATPQPSVWMLW